MICFWETHTKSFSWQGIVAGGCIDNVTLNEHILTNENQNDTVNISNENINNLTNISLNENVNLTETDNETIDNIENGNSSNQDN